MCKNCFTTFHNIKDIQDHFNEGDCITKKHTKRKNKRKIINRKSKQDEIIQEINNLMPYISTTKKYSKLLTQIKAARLNLLNYMDIPKYKAFILHHLPFESMISTSVPSTRGSSVIRGALK